MLVFIIPAHHNLFFLQKTCTSKQKVAKLVNEANPPPALAQPHAHRTRKIIEKSQKTLPRSRALHLYAAKSEAEPSYQSTLYSLGFFKTYHLSCVRAPVCFPGRTLLELLIFGNVPVLSESKHATRFRGQPQRFFPALVSSRLLTHASLLPGASRDSSHWPPGVRSTAKQSNGQDLPQAVGREDPQTSPSDTPPETLGAGSPPWKHPALGSLGAQEEISEGRASTFDFHFYLSWGKAKQNREKIFISPPSPQPPRKRSGFGGGL